jgi:hypothetical protein
VTGREQTGRAGGALSAMEAAAREEEGEHEEKARLIAQVGGGD